MKQDRLYWIYKEDEQALAFMDTPAIRSPQSLGEGFLHHIP
jgi:hypothetical protein